MAEEKSMSKQEFDTIYSGHLDTIHNLLLSHPDIPDDVQQSELAMSLDAARKEIDRSVNGKIPEIEKLNEKIAALEKLNRSLQNTTNEYYLQLRAVEQGALSRLGGEEKPKLTEREIHRNALEYISALG